MILGTSLGKKKRGLFDPPEPWRPWQTPGIGDGLPGAQAGMPLGTQRANQTTPALPDSNNAPELDPMVRAMIGNAPEQPKRFWQGGNKFRALDGVAAALAVIGDTLDPQKNGGAVGNLTGARSRGLTKFEELEKAYQDRQRIASLPKMSPREFAAYSIDPKAWGSNMSRAATSRYDAATLNPGDQRYLGEGNGVYQAPTRGQQYAQSLDLSPGTDPYRNAIRDQELGANGPTAFGNDQAIQNIRAAAAREQEILRQKGRMGLEGVRQNNRMSVRGAPTYRDLNAPAPRAALPRAPRKNDMPLVSSPADAMKLPAGTKFRTPDGRVMER